MIFVLTVVSGDRNCSVCASPQFIIQTNPLGVVGTTQQQCEERGCCWNETDVSGVSGIFSYVVLPTIVAIHPRASRGAFRRQEE